MINLDETTIEIVIGLHIFFDDYKKAKDWINTKNLNFGGVAPLELINRGRGKKVLQFINNALEEGKRL